MAGGFMPFFNARLHAAGLIADGSGQHETY
jgi:hypothetical protein